MITVGTVYSKESSFTDKDILNILGSDKVVLGMFNNRSLVTEITLSDGYLEEKFLGTKGTRKPYCIVSFLKYLVKELKGESNNFKVMYFAFDECGNDIRLTIGFEDDVEVIFIENTSSGLKYKKGVADASGKFSSPEEFLERFSEVLYYYLSISPVPLYGGEYWLSEYVDSPNKIGLGDRYYLGLSEASMFNGMDVNDRVEGEYVLAFLEIV